MPSELLPIVILVGPQGCGKSTQAPTIAAKFGCTQIVDPWDGLTELSPGTLAVTNAAFACPANPAGEVADAA